jgi:hypothetical protein
MLSTVLAIVDIPYIYHRTFYTVNIDMICLYV